MVIIIFAVLHISTHARALLLLLPAQRSCSTAAAAALTHHHRHYVMQHQPVNPPALLSPIITGGTSARAAAVRHSQMVCSAAAKSIASQQGGTGGTSNANDRDLDAGIPRTRAEALTGFVAAVASSAALLSEVSRARADGDAGPSGLGVVDDLLADCPSVRGKQQVAADMV